MFNNYFLIINFYIMETQDTKRHNPVDISTQTSVYPKKRKENRGRLVSTKMPHIIDEEKKILNHLRKIKKIKNQIMEDETSEKLKRIKEEINELEKFRSYKKETYHRPEKKIVTAPEKIRERTPEAIVPRVSTIEITTSFDPDKYGPDDKQLIKMIENTQQRFLEYLKKLYLLKQKEESDNIYIEIEENLKANLSEYFNTIINSDYKIPKTVDGNPVGKSAIDNGSFNSKNNQLQIELNAIIAKIELEVLFYSENEIKTNANAIIDKYEKKIQNCQLELDRYQDAAAAFQVSKSERLNDICSDLNHIKHRLLDNYHKDQNWFFENFNKLKNYITECILSRENKRLQEIISDSELTIKELSSELRLIQESKVNSEDVLSSLSQKIEPIIPRINLSEIISSKKIVSFVAVKEPVSKDILIKYSQEHEKALQEKKQKVKVPRKRYNIINRNIQSYEETKSMPELNLSEVRGVIIKKTEQENSSTTYEKIKTHPIRTGREAITSLKRGRETSRA
jgi:hypothetical protein